MYFLQKVTGTCKGGEGGGTNLTNNALLALGLVLENPQQQRLQEKHQIPWALNFIETIRSDYSYKAALSNLLGHDPADSKNLCAGYLPRN